MSRVKLGIIAGIGTFMLSFVLIIGVGASNRQKADMPVSEILTKLAKAADEMVGKKVAPNIVVSGASIDDNLRLTYKYRVTGESQVDQKIARQKSQIIRRQACSDRMMRKAVDGGAEIRYIYFSRIRKPLLTIKVNPVICENLA